ncbi:putative RNA-dependent RNA polymerase [Freshwater macrophyte associated yue-like virus 1]|nr:putative RNA-dependent RNA polymerase [Freshwater macrophyte associated yue-like virus 1]
MMTMIFNLSYDSSERYSDAEEVKTFISIRERQLFEKKFKYDLGSAQDMDLAFRLMMHANMMDKMRSKAYDNFTATMELNDKDRSEDIDVMSKKERERYRGLSGRGDEVYSRYKEFFLVHLGHTYYMGYGNKRFFISRLHFDRAMAMVRSLAAIILTLIKAPKRLTSSAMMLRIVEKINSMSDENPESIGRWIKGARSLYVASLAKDNLLGISAYDLILSDFDGQRKKWSVNYMRFIESLTDSNYTRFLLLDLYKFTPHPDSNMERLFDTLDGLHDPNEVDQDYLTRFEGMSRKSLYKSLSKLGHDVRGYSRSGLSYNPVARDMNSTQKDVNKMNSYSYLYWADIEFEACPTITPTSEIKLKPSNKASVAPFEAEFPKDLGSNIDNLKKEIKNINDIQSVMNGTSQFNKSRSIKRFQELIEEHEKFEQSMDVKEPEEISYRDLAKFVLSNKKARTITSTEPKYGEYHKEITRMFYMAEQQIKELTQSVERLMRQISRKQSGVSIVKSHPARRADTEAFAKAMFSGTDEIKPIFISFDMSEFSKKFPMKLIRIYGKILSELTGEDWLRRLDLFFRSSVVVHNTRGYINYTSGVKGGFEGFLNFVWSSIHATIMEVAMDVAGIVGELLTFSDDGLLLFYVKESSTQQEIKDTVYKLQDIYSKLGLEFKFQKTIVSGVIWEYLGEICVDGMIIVTFTKELSMMFKDEEPILVETISGRLRKLTAKCKACIRRGMDPYTSYLLCMIRCFEMISNYIKGLGNLTTFALMIIPENSGGLRIPSLMELSTETNIEEYSEFIADLHNLGELIESGRIMSRIASNMRVGLEGVMSCLTGGRYSTRLNSNSDDVISVLSGEFLNDYVNINFPVHPLGGMKKREIGDYLTLFKNINMNAIQRIVMSTPLWNEYMDACKFARSQAILKLIPKRKVNLLRFRIEGRIRRNLIDWRTSLKSSSGPSMTLGSFFKKTVSPLEGMFSVPKPSSRLCLTMTDDMDISIPMYIGQINIRSDSTILDTTYIERGLQTPETFTTNSWLSESGGDSSAVRKMLKSIGAVISQSPELANLCLIVLSKLGYPIPTIGSQTVSSLARRSVVKGTWVEAAAYGPAPLITVTSSTETRSLHDIHSLINRADRTTYKEVVKTITSMNAYNIGDLRSDTMNYIKSFKIDEELKEGMFRNYEAFSDSTYDEQILRDAPKLDQRLSDEFNESMKEIMSYIDITDNYANVITDVSSMDKSSLELSIAILKERFLKFLVSVYRNSYNPIAERKIFSLPKFSRKEIISDTFVLASLELMEPQLRTSLQTLLYKPYSFYKGNIDIDVETNRDASNVISQEDKAFYDNPAKFVSETRDAWFSDDDKAEDNIPEEWEDILCDDTDRNMDDEDLAEEINYKDRLNPVNLVFEKEIKEHTRDDIMAFVNDKERMGINLDMKDVAQAEFVRIYNTLVASFRDTIDFMDDYSNLSSIDSITPEIAKVIGKNLFSNIMTSLNIAPRVVIRSPEFPDSKITHSHKTAYRQLLSATLVALRTEMRLSSWNAEKSLKNIGSKYGGNVDELIDCLILMRAILRPSKHRSIEKPYNPTTFIIEFFKFNRHLYILQDYARKCLAEDKSKNPNLSRKELVSILNQRIANINLKDFYCMNRMGKKDIDEVKGFLENKLKRDGDFGSGLKGNDHYTLIDMPVVRSLWHRFSSYFKMFYLGVIQIKPMGFEDIRNLSSAVYSSFLSVAVSNMRTLTISEAEFMSRVSDLDQSAYTNALIDRADCSFIDYGNEKLYEILSYNWVSSIFKELFRDAYSKGHFIGINIKNSSSEIRDIFILDDEISTSHTEGTTIGFNTDADAYNLYFYADRTTRKKALSTYMSFNQRDIISSSIFCSGDMYTFMIMTNKPYSRNKSGVYLPEETMSLIDTSVITGPTAAFSLLNKSVNTRMGMPLEISGMPTLTVSAMTESYRRLAGEKRIHINDAKELCVAYELMKGCDDASMQVLIYVLFKMYIFRLFKIKGKGFKQELLEMSKIYKRRSGVRFTKLQNDMSMVLAWLAIVAPVPMSATDEKETNELYMNLRDNVIKKIPTLGNSIISTVTTMRPLLPINFVEDDFDEETIYASIFETEIETFNQLDYKDEEPQDDFDFDDSDLGL